MTILLFAAVALADIPPPEGYVETCTEKSCPEGQEARTCPGWHGGREECEKLEAQGFTRVCRTRGASAWTEVMCKAGSSLVPNPPEPTPDQPKPDEPKPPEPVPPEPARPTPTPPPPAPAQEAPPERPPRCETVGATSFGGLLAALALSSVRRATRRRPTGRRSTS